MNDPTTPPAGRPSRFLLAAAICVVGAVGVGWAVGKFRTAQPEPMSAPETAATAAASSGRGALLYQVHCAACHGPDGHGDGPSAAALRPPPRDFAARPWRFEPTPEAIRRVTLDGIAGTGMASFRPALASAEVDQLVGYVLDLATAHPPVIRELSPEDQLIRDAGFIDLRGTDPPALVVADAADKELRLSALTGRVVLLHFWGTACVHCLKEMPALNELEAELTGRGLTVVHVCADTDDVRDAQEVARRAVPGVRVFAAGAGVGLARFEVQSLPTVWLIDRTGKAVARSHGARDWKAPAVRKLIEHLTRLPGPRGDQ